MAVDRAELRAWLEANCPPEMREPAGEDDVCWGGRRFGQSPRIKEALFLTKPVRSWCASFEVRT